MTDVRVRTFKMFTYSPAPAIQARLIHLTMHRVHADTASVGDLEGSHGAALRQPKLHVVHKFTGKGYWSLLGKPASAADAGLFPWFWLAPGS